MCEFQKLEYTFFEKYLNDIQKDLIRPSYPYFTVYQDSLGLGPLYDRKAIEKFAQDQPKTIKKRILGLKPGSKLKISSTGKYSEQWLVRLTPDQVSLIEKKLKLLDEKSGIETLIYQKTLELQNEKRRIQREISDTVSATLKLKLNI